MAKPAKKKLARNLRRQGKSIKSIAKDLSVSSSSVSIWCRDITLTKKQIKVLEKNSKDPFYGKRLEYSKLLQQKRILKEKKLYKDGIAEVGKISIRELFLIGIALYWGEGFKKDTQAGFANQDPNMLKTFLVWINRCFGYQPKDLIFRLTINESHKHREKELVTYWAQELGVDISNFRKTYIQKVKWKKEFENPNSYKGILRIKVRRSTDFLRKIKGYIAGLSLGVEEYKI